MTATAVSIFSAIVTAIIIGLVRFAFSQPGPYRRLFALIHDGVFTICLCIFSATIAYIAGVAIGRHEAGVEPPEFSPWVIVPLLTALAVYVLLVLLIRIPAAIGISEKREK